MKGLEMISFSATNPGAGGAAGVIFPGDSSLVRNFTDSSKAYLLQMWADLQAVGFVNIRSALLHDNVRGIQVDVPASEVDPLLAIGSKQSLFRTDQLVSTIAAADAAGDVETFHLLNYYEDAPGADALLLTFDQVMSKIKQLTTVDCTIAAAAGPGYSGAEAINAESDLLHAGSYYALLGAVCRVECGAIGVRSSNWSNLRVGIPGNETDRNVNASFFSDLSRLTGLPLIPCFNADNKGNTFIDVSQDENAAAVPVTLLLAELDSSPL